MSLDAFRKALDDLSDTACCEGTCRLTERLAIALPDGDVGAVDDATFVDWLLAHSEPAPFGMGGETKLDPKVRDAQRLIARGGATMSGFEPAQILGEIEAALSPREHLDAQLTDVLVYRKGGHFTRHKDTPNHPDLVGTLVVGLPIAHAGGAFHITDGGEPQIVDWSGKKPSPSTVPWVAMFSDVDHEIKPVTSGSRVTLVYALMRSNRPRPDPSSDKTLATLDKLASRLPIPARGPLMIACARHVITEDETQPQGVEVLRGTDRAIAALLIEHGYTVSVRSCVTAAFAYQREQTNRLRSEDVFSISRLSKSLSPKLIASLENLVTFAKLDKGEEEHVMTLAPYILDAIAMDRWVVRKNAAATLIHESEDFSEDGSYGNEGYEAHIYTLAAIEVTKPKAKAKALAKQAPAKKVPAKKAVPAKKKVSKRR
jgi:hypothetical protein